MTKKYLRKLCLRCIGAIGWCGSFGYLLTISTGNVIDRANEYVNVCANENAVNWGRTILQDIDLEKYYFDDEHDKFNEKCNSYRLSGDQKKILSNNIKKFYLNYGEITNDSRNNCVDNETIVELAQKETSKIESLINKEIKENNNKFTCWRGFFNSHSWASIGWETAIALSWVTVITIWGIDVAMQLYELYNGNFYGDFQGDFINDFVGLKEWIHGSAIDGALKFKKESNCSWTYHW